jgi:hypothetical protein
MMADRWRVRNNRQGHVALETDHGFLVEFETSLRREANKLCKQLNADEESPADRPILPT